MDTNELDRNVTFIEDHPEQHNQAVWTCETGACLAGHIVLNNGYLPHLDTDSKYGAVVEDAHGKKAMVSRTARRLIDATLDESDLLFAGGNTAQTLREMTKDAQNGEDITQLWHLITRIDSDPEMGVRVIKTAARRR